VNGELGVSVNHRQYVTDALSLRGALIDKAVSERDRGIVERYIAGKSADRIGAEYGISGERVKVICSRVAERATGCGWRGYRLCASAEEGMELLHYHRARHWLRRGQMES